jgi:putative ABC transport system ATP-binding protein
MNAGMNLLAPAPTVFRARGLSKIYRTGEVEVQALRDVDLEIARGEFVVLLGASGSGKSTLLNILGGLDVPSSGEVSFGEHRLSGAGEAELTSYRREHVGFVFQFYQPDPEPDGA